MQFHLNIFELSPAITSLAELSQADGINYGILPNSLTSMRLRSDDYKFIPFISELFYTKHKMGGYNSPWGLQRGIRQFEKLIEKDMININKSVARWRELHQPARVDWNGNRLE